MALWLDVAGPIGPATVRYIERGLAQARRQQAALVVIALDTPGGLDLAMRQIVQALLASPIPVVVHVSPEGARAASAGTFLLYAAHVAAMAPATTLGAATPVPLSLPLPTLPPGTPSAAPEAGPDARPDARSGARPDPRPGVQPEGSTDPHAASAASAAERKSVHDAAAYIRGLAQHHGRNADWAERAVREAVSLTAAEALREGVIDLIADSPQDLLQALDGRTVRLGDRQVTLRTAGLERQPLPPRAHERLIATLTQPGVALLLLMLGIWGLVLEFSQPGFGVAGTVGAVSLLLALYALQMLPFNVVGLALLGLGLVLMVAEALTPGLGVLGLGGHGRIHRRWPAAVRRRRAGLRHAAVGRAGSGPGVGAGHVRGVEPGLEGPWPARRRGVGHAGRGAGAGDRHRSGRRPPGLGRGAGGAVARARHGRSAHR